MAKEKLYANESIIVLKPEEAKGFMKALEKCFRHAGVFTEEEMNSLEKVYNVLMDLE